MRTKILNAMRVLTICLIGIGLFMTYSCTKEEITPRTYPRVTTISVVNSAGTLSLTGEILFASVPITDHGFIYTSAGYPSMTNTLATVVSLGSTSGTGQFMETITNLTSPKEYSIRAYAQSADKLVYGEILAIKI